MQTSQSVEELAVTQTEPHDGHPVEMGQRVYVWELPVRITHWSNVLSILVLSITGIYIEFPFMYIARPFAGVFGLALPTDQYMMGTVRYIHFLTAFVFTASVLFRVYWAFVGNHYARWQQLVPLRASRRRGVRHMAAFYAFLRRDPPATVGHNALAGTAYMAVFVLFLIQIFTGFALYSLPFHDGFWPTTFGWIITVFGVQPIKLLHDITMWLLIAFTVHHVYSAILIDIEERSGLVSSIITGYKSLTRSFMAEARSYDVENQRESVKKERRKHA